MRVTITKAENGYIIEYDVPEYRTKTLVYSTLGDAMEAVEGVLAGGMVNTEAPPTKTEL